MKLYEEILKNADIGIDAINNVQCAVKDEKFLNVLCEQKKEYVKFKVEVEKQLDENTIKDALPPKMQKAMMKMGTKMNTLFDSSNTNIAEMMIEGTNMGINDIQKEINQMQIDGSEIPELATDYIQMMQSNVDQLRTFL